MLKEHIESTAGQGEAIHAFIDQYWEMFEDDHRVVLHHKKGVAYLVKKFGEENRRIIMQHMLDDGYVILREDQHDPRFKDWAGKKEQARQFADSLFTNI